MKKNTLWLTLLCLSLLTACGEKKALPPGALDGPPVVPVIKPKGEATLGQNVFDKTCALCHGAGVSGAPRPGDKAAWAPRIAQGNEVLFKRAIEGYSGERSYMPARGGNPKLTDEEVKAGVMYMVAQSQ
ncbi:MAG: cytochrome c5 family protein [Rhodoferax sp.]|jgi:cytochrome c5|nr:cytochrome c5 family protein [Rhodoferax sp.]MBP9059367.1 cytochrome c5 family protein [Rhodoferax sp.]MBP9683234.1 cytochrome c5 family protein [Rhodoferax sp.]